MVVSGSKWSLKQLERSESPRQAGVTEWELKPAPENSQQQKFGVGRAAQEFSKHSNVQCKGSCWNRQHKSKGNPLEISAEGQFAVLGGSRVKSTNADPPSSLTQTWL